MTITGPEKRGGGGGAGGILSLLNLKSWWGWTFINLHRYSVTNVIISNHLFDALRLVFFLITLYTYMCY